MGLCYVCVAMAMWTSGIFSSGEEWFSFPSQSQDSLCLNPAWQAQSTNLRLTLTNLSPSMLVEELERGGLRGWVLSLEFLFALHLANSKGGCRWSACSQVMTACIRSLISWTANTVLGLQGTASNTASARMTPFCPPSHRRLLLLLSLASGLFC